MTVADRIAAVMDVGALIQALLQVEIYEQPNLRLGRGFHRRRT